MSDPRTRRPLDTVRPDIRALQGYTPGEQLNDAIKLNTNESALPPAPGVLAVLRGLAEDQLRLYPDPQATALRAAAAARFGLRPEQVVAGNGSDDCLTILYRSHCVAGDRIACPWPTYGLYATLAGIQGVDLQRHPYRDTGPGGRWLLPEDELAGSGARLVLVANPNNPSGTMVAVDTLRRLADAIDGILVVDEAYVDFAAGGSILPQLDQHPNLVVLRTFSKSYSLAGARLGLLFAHAELCAEYRKVKDSYNVNALTQAVGVAALEDTAHHAELVARTLAGRAELEALCQELGWSWAPSHANFLLCDVGPRAEAIAQSLKAGGILVRWWNTPELRERLRITVGAPEQQARLAQALRDLVRT
jgi:histidinol-phosphate aminotransferase